LNVLLEYLTRGTRDDIEMVKLLISNTMQKSNLLNDYLDYAKNPNKEVVKFLIDRGASVYENTFENLINKTNINIESLRLLMNATINKDVGQFLQQKPTFLYNYLTKVENPNKDVVKLLIENGPDFKYLADHFGADKALSIYLKHAENSNSEVLKLLTLDTNPNSIDEEGNTAMHFYLKRRDPSPEILKILLGTNIDTMLNDVVYHVFRGKNEYNFTYDIAKIKSFLYKEKLNLNVQNNAGESFLHTYLKHAENPNPKIIKLFLCNVDIRDNDGKSPLDICRQRGVEQRIAKILTGHEKSLYIARSREANDDFINDSIDSHVIEITGSDSEENNG